MKVFGVELSHRTTTIAELGEHVNLAAELALAKKDVGEAERKLNIICASRVELLERQSSFERAANVRRAVEVGREVAELDHAAKSVERLVTEARSALDKITEHINKLPTYKSALEKQRDFVLRAAELGKASWHCPLPELRGIQQQLASLADQEERFVFETNQVLRGLGLPEMRARIERFRFNILPTEIANMNLGALESEAGEFTRRMLEF
jgi:hypothetical protein